jgi:hypothetical protein
LEPFKKIDVNEAILVLSLQIVDAKASIDPHWAEDSGTNTNTNTLNNKRTKNAHTIT